MTEQKIMVRGGKDLGDCTQVDGTWYIRRDSFWVDGADMEDGWDVQIETGWYSHVELPTTPEEEAYVQAYVAEQERKEVERIREMHEKYDAINERLWQEQAAKKAAKEEQLRKRMLKELPVGTRVQNKFTEKRGVVVAHHETKPELSIQWDGQDHPDCIFGTTMVQWFGFFSQKAI